MRTSLRLLKTLARACPLASEEGVGERVIPTAVSIPPCLKKSALQPVSAMGKYRLHRQVVVSGCGLDPVERGIGPEQVIGEPAHGLATKAAASVALGDPEVEQRAAHVDVVDVQDADHPDGFVALAHPERHDVICGHHDRGGIRERKSRHTVERPLVRRQKLDGRASVIGRLQPIEPQGHQTSIAAASPEPSQVLYGGDAGGTQCGQRLGLSTSPLSHLFRDPPRVGMTPEPTVLTSLSPLAGQHAGTESLQRTIILLGSPEEPVEAAMRALHQLQEQEYGRGLGVPTARCPRRVGERVVAGNLVVAHAHQREQGCDDDAGAVPTCGAINSGRKGIAAAQPVDDRAEALLTHFEHLEVPLCNRLWSLVPRRHPRGTSGGEQGNVVTNRANRHHVLIRNLGRQAQIDDDLHAEVVQLTAWPEGGGCAPV